MDRTEKEIQMEEYLEQVKIFKEMTPEEAEKLIEAKEGNVIFIGRETCPYCRRFAKKLYEIAIEYDIQIHYVHSKHPDYKDEIETLRDKYDVVTVPGLIYSSKNSDVIVKCDSSLTEEEILEIIEINWSGIL